MTIRINAHKIRIDEYKILECGYEFNFDDDNKKLIKTIFTDLTDDASFNSRYVYSNVKSFLHKDHVTTFISGKEGQHKMLDWYNNQKKIADFDAKLIGISYHEQFMVGTMKVGQKNIFYVFFSKPYVSTPEEQFIKYLKGYYYKKVVTDIVFKCKPYIKTEKI